MKKNILIAMGLVFLAAPCLADSLDDTRKAAEQGDAWAQTELGTLYAEGRGVPHDDTEAVKWYRQAAEQGQKYAQFALGTRYRDGRGVPRNYVSAYMWYSLSAKQGGVEGATQERDAMKKLITPDQRDEVHKTMREWKPNES